ncbi:N-acetylmuramoyl-L-alanine amidase-like domain-containing protein [Marinilabilia rubra]|uniref:DUF1460 domain-containing protein n=1 Tax=Marinilabilia rubra TaxID=2162893 RepID=A0A2U2B3C0_9BACT|nr:N-acetylmuramoyl-L-alanine amidase-like domain-containing protein [Marinilabilia rubra]PWD97566.1 hypothetical protein DDZ16_19970 [Marinilabilia rubra]
MIHISNDFGDMIFDANVGFMSSNADKYLQLSGNPSFVDVMKSIEKRISQYDYKCVSEDQIEQKAKYIKDGDIIAFCSNIEGLDVAHTALAYHIDNQLHFIHASTTEDKVVVSEKSMAGYVKDRKNVYGILVARPVFKN